MLSWAKFNAAALYNVYRLAWCIQRSCFLDIVIASYMPRRVPNRCFEHAGRCARVSSPRRWCRWASSSDLLLVRCFPPPCALLYLSSHPHLPLRRVVTTLFYLSTLSCSLARFDRRVCCLLAARSRAAIGLAQPDACCCEDSARKARRPIRLSLLGMRLAWLTVTPR